MNQETYIAELQNRIAAEYQEALKRFPQPGAKLRYRGVKQFWFTNIIANAERELRLGEMYTLKAIKLHSSWACITLEETGDTEFTLGFFDVISKSTDEASGPLAPA